MLPQPPVCGSEHGRAEHAHVNAVPVHEYSKVLSARQSGTDTEEIPYRPDLVQLPDDNAELVGRAPRLDVTLEEQ